MNIIFVGNEVSGNFALDPCERLGHSIEYTGTYTHVREIVNLVLMKPYQVMIFDVDMFIDEAEEIAEEIDRIGKVNNAKVIIYAAGYSTESAMIVSLVRVGFQNFILSVNPSGKIEQLEKSLNGYYEANGMGELQPVIEEIESAAPPPQQILPIKQSV